MPIDSNPLKFILTFVCWDGIIFFLETLSLNVSLLCDANAVTYTCKYENTLLFSVNTEENVFSCKYLIISFIENKS